MSKQLKAEQASAAQRICSYSSLTSAVVDEPRFSSAVGLLFLLTGQDNLHDSIVTGLEDCASEHDALGNSGIENPAKVRLKATFLTPQGHCSVHSLMVSVVLKGCCVIFSVNELNEICLRWDESHQTCRVSGHFLDTRCSRNVCHM